MPKKLNALLKKELATKLEKVTSGVLVNYQGLPSEETYALRKELNAKKIKMTVVKNSTAAIALKELGAKDFEPLLKGPLAICYQEDPVVVASALTEWRKKNKKTKLEIKGVLLDRKALPASDVAKLAALPSKHQLYGQLAGTLNAPITGLVQALAGVLRKPLYALNAAKDKLEKGGAPAA